MATPVFAQRIKWWQSADVQRELQLSPDQVSSIEDVFQQTLPQRRALRHRLEEQERDVRQLLDRGGPVDDAAIDSIELLETLRAHVNVERMRMLLRIRRLLTAEQRTRLERLARRR
jgi:Spy/CpxP family protein refolding chaperone